MSKVLMGIVALLIGSFAAAFYFLTQNPLILAWGGAVGVLGFLGGVYWNAYTVVAHPDKFARLYARYIADPLAEAGELRTKLDVALLDMKGKILTELAKLQAKA